MQDIKQQEDLLSRELDVLENAISDENRALAICSREEIWKKIDRLISLAVEQEKERIIEAVKNIPTGNHKRADMRDDVLKVINNK